MARIAKPAPKKPFEATGFQVTPLQTQKETPEAHSTRGKNTQVHSSKPRIQGKHAPYLKSRGGSRGRGRGRGRGGSRNFDQRPQQNQQYMSQSAINNKACFSCRQHGHVTKDCPMAKDMGVGKCYHCGRSDHTSRHCTLPKEEQTFQFSTCFICKNMGHLASKCPQNSNGIYINGGACRLCGSNQHFAMHCGKITQKEATDVVGKITADQGGDDDDMFVTYYEMDRNRQQKSSEGASATSSATHAVSSAQKVTKPKVVNF
ncbi:Zinc finger CCHC domain-containing protein 9 [Dispira parvispora]|uniref:Zinc finger CCHC domain-containing protein 9 n=1 Tax=Dispira parvispora TaxID=1520584 RepID=A0A9W8E7C3_9FUNG|nr:Zinc finger CCHC domain-containing protein 9 [Dispira parvispora]